MNVKKLSDQQLYGLFMDKKLTRGVRIIVIKEMERREFTIHKMDELDIHYHNVLNGNVEELTAVEKGLIVIFPFFVLIHAILANTHLSKGSKKNWKVHWKLIAVGYLLWTIVILALAKFGVFK